MQIIGYETGESEPNTDPTLIVSDGPDVNSLTLANGTDLSYQLTTRHCVGTQSETGQHTSCPNETAPYCSTHDDIWPCALCRGDCYKPLDACNEEHAIYIAAFAPKVFKVGVTRSWRLKTRLREQGADQAAHIRTVDDGKIARQIEADIATNLTDRVRVPTKIKSLHQSVTDDAWETLLSDFDVIEEFAFDYNLSLEQQPIQETLLSGTIKGTKGRVLLLENSGTVYAVDLRNLLGYEFEQSTSSQELQSSLTSF